jgi:hypothetical protein
MQAAGQNDLSFYANVLLSAAGCLTDTDPVAPTTNLACWAAGSSRSWLMGQSLDAAYPASLALMASEELPGAMLAAGQVVQQGDWQRRWQQTLVSRPDLVSSQTAGPARAGIWSLQVALGRDDSSQPTETPDTACRFQCSPWLEATSAPDPALWSCRRAAAVPLCAFQLSFVPFCTFAAYFASQPGPPPRPVPAEL